jgi:tripartite-type tricarboxylate transporter receptor subunit TctC
MKMILSGLALAAVFVSPPVPAQYPTKPVRLVVGFPPGGGVDIMARFVSQKLTERWGKPVVVENRGGAAGNIATELVAKSAPDGHTLTMAFSSYASNPALYPDLPFDINKDFTSVTLVATAPVVVIASPSLPAKNLAELIEYARAHPGAVKFASSGIGTPVHLGGELMMQLTGTRMTHVPYKGIAPAMTAMLAGETEISFVAVLSGMQHFKSGRLKPLAIASRSRYPGLPEVPTTAEAGLNGFEIDYWYAVLGPAGLPRPIVEQLQREIAAIVNAPENRESLLAQGSISVGGTPEELTALIRRDYALWSKVVKAGGVKVE